MKENKISSLIAHLFQGVFLLITAVLCVGPFVWVIFSSFKSNKEILNSAFALPNAWNFDGYRRALEMSPIFLFFGNSVFISITNTIISVLVVAMAAYAMAGATLCHVHEKRNWHPQAGPVHIRSYQP